MQNGVRQLHNVLRAFRVEVGRDFPIPPRKEEHSQQEHAVAAIQSAGFGKFLKNTIQRLSGQTASTPILPSSPVLLVDDMIDSGWTLTVAAVLLRRHGSGPVYPFALAKASPRGS